MPAQPVLAEEVDLFAAVLKADPNWFRDSERVVEFNFSNGRQFHGYYKTRGPYGPPNDPPSE